jgi:hypothetical protein
MRSLAFTFVWCLEALTSSRRRRLRPAAQRRFRFGINEVLTLIDQVIGESGPPQGSPRHHGRCFDLDPRRLFNEPHDLHQRHGGIMRAENLAIDLA